MKTHHTPHRHARTTGTLLLVLSLALPARAGERITISGAWALYPLVMRWTEAYQSVVPDVAFDVSAGGAGKGMTDVLSGAVDLAMLSREPAPAELERGAVALRVARDAVIPVISAKGPGATYFRDHGVTRAQLADIWVTGSVTNWMQLGVKASAPLRAYTRSDACGAAATWASFFAKAQEDLKGVGVFGDPGIAETVVRDVLGIGYNNVAFAYDAASGKPLPGLQPLPIDLDADGTLAPAENFYADRAQLLAAISDGRYPSPPARALYLVTRGNPSATQLRAFLAWVLEAGQTVTVEAGFIPPTAAELEQGRKLLRGTP